MNPTSSFLQLTDQVNRITQKLQSTLGRISEATAGMGQASISGEQRSCRWRWCSWKLKMRHYTSQAWLLLSAGKPATLRRLGYAPGKQQPISPHAYNHLVRQEVSRRCCLACTAGAAPQPSPLPSLTAASASAAAPKTGMSSQQVYLWDESYMPPSKSLSVAALLWLCR